MARKRSPENDFICRRCGCPCDQAGSKHVGGGQGMKACQWAPDPILRSEHEAEARAIVQSIRSRHTR